MLRKGPLFAALCLSLTGCAGLAPYQKLPQNASYSDRLRAYWDHKVYSPYYDGAPVPRVRVGDTEVDVTALPGYFRSSGDEQDANAAETGAWICRAGALPFFALLSASVLVSVHLIQTSSGEGQGAAELAAVPLIYLGYGLGLFSWTKIGEVGVRHDMGPAISKFNVYVSGDLGFSRPPPLPAPPIPLATGATGPLRASKKSGWDRFLDGLVGFEHALFRYTNPYQPQAW